jgi:hypothetical protein
MRASLCSLVSLARINPPSTLGRKTSCCSPCQPSIPALPLRHSTESVQALAQCFATNSSTSTFCYYATVINASASLATSMCFMLGRASITAMALAEDSMNSFHARPAEHPAQALCSVRHDPARQALGMLQCVAQPSRISPPYALGKVSVCLCLRPHKPYHSLRHHRTPMVLDNPRSWEAYGDACW